MPQYTQAYGIRGLLLSPIRYRKSVPWLVIQNMYCVFMIDYECISGTDYECISGITKNKTE